ncbi:hypothetical protein BGX27_007134 [Mortierella sp. AM989]|nr:hypothetical protein BGX27_007134 [Mortierella sp. AM989]
MSSAANTLLQYLLIVSVVYLYSKTLRGKKASFGSTGGALGKLQASGLTDYYADRKKRPQAVRKKDSEKNQSAAELASVQTSVKSSNPSETASPEERALSHHHKSASSGSAPTSTSTSTSTSSPKKLSKRSSSSSSSPSIKQNAVRIAGTSVAKKQQQKTISSINESTGTATNASDIVLPIPAEEAARHHRSLCEMFKNIPSSEIDRVIRTVHWDVDEAAALLAQEDYTWQSVRRRRGVPK